MAKREWKPYRQDYLEQRGFLNWEAVRLCEVPIRTPYFRPLVRQRARLFKSAVKQGWSAAEYETYIRQMYHDRDWLRRDGLGKLVPDVWAMVRAREADYRSRHPEYDSPSQRKAVKKKRETYDQKTERFMAKEREIDEGMKYPTGAAYPRRRRR